MRTAAVAFAPSGAPRRLLARMFARLALWFAVRGERLDLSSLDDAQLRDIGIDPAAARREAVRPFWEVPQSRSL